MNILTVAVVTKPFNFEGAQRMKNAEEGIKNLKNFVDTLLVIPNQKLIEVLDKNISFKRAFEIADDVLRQGVQGVSDVIANPELINLDFADVRTILSNKGLAHMGIGYGKGEKRVIEAVRGAVFSPLLETDIEGATGIIVNITGGDDMLLGEVTEACDIVKQVVDPSANIILGTAFVPDKRTSKSPSSQRDLWIETLLLQEAAHLNLKIFRNRAFSSGGNRGREGRRTTCPTRTTRVQSRHLCQ